MGFDLAFTQAPVTAFLDFYKWTMLQAMLHQLEHKGGVRLQYRYSLRSDGAQTSRIKDVLREALDEFDGRQVMLEEELEWARSIRYFKPTFVDDYLRDIRLHTRDMVDISVLNGELNIAIEGGITSTLLETVVLATISELMVQTEYPTKTEREKASDRGIDALRKELAALKVIVSRTPEKRFRLTEGGTRRRFSTDHHRRVLELLMAEVPRELFGTSNIRFARDYDLRPVGTQAHEFGMLFQQHGGTLATFVTRALQAWVEEYRGDLGYALPDVLTTEAFLRSFDLYFAKLFDGLRQDSGDPHEWTQLVIEHLQSLGIDPASKFAVYSDTLTLQAALDLWHHYEGHPWKTSYLIGTFLTNNIPGYRALNQVIKLVGVNGQPVAKISDEPSKAMCDSPDFLTTLRRTFRIPDGEGQ